ncbi:hypothetical protein BDZ94DRAFT_1048457 [Collybia nuda]|uniref:Uncharacterized protein n=1 Tax=Collybia nuda TaxID=64659 RepID=A0A9P5Y138_9AGAR|nr:hypothetical protein BDZ94DRAFT_1048457 [Collybia nuda]
MHAVYGRCIGLTIPGASGRLNKLRATLKAWSNCNVVEAEIMELKDEVQAFSMRFMMFAIARVEKPISSIALATSRIEKSLNALDRHQRLGLSRMEGFVASLSPNTPTDINYSQPVIVNTAKAPDNQIIPSEAVEELYLHRQVETISTSLGSLSTAHTPVNEQPRGPYLQPFKPDVPRQWGTDQTPSACHREVVAAAWEIIDILQSPPGERAVQYGAWRMVNLAIRLHGLEMYSDAATIGSWTVDLYRTLMNANTQVYEPYLSLALRNLSRYRTDTGEHEAASIAIEECVTREREMLGKPVRHSVHLELSNSLLEWWCIVTRDGNLDKGLKIAWESLAHLESIRAQLREWEVSMMHTLGETSSSETIVVGPGEGRSSTTLRQPSSCIQGWDNASTLWLDYNTARTFQILSYSLEGLGQIQDAWERALQALAIYRDLCKRHSGNFDANLAGCLAYISHLPHRHDPSPLASIACIQESIHLYRKLSASRPAKFTSRLIESLRAYASLLRDAGDFDVARDCSDEALELAKRSNQIVPCRQSLTVDTEPKT